MMDLASVRDEFTKYIDQLTFEVNTLWQQFQDTDWYENQAHFPYAHYGYMMVILARVDLLSRYWAGDYRGQTRRMVAFLDTYFHHDKHHENCIAVQLWRHTVMHTGEARRLFDTSTSKTYTWYISFGSMPQPVEHYTIQHGSDDLLYLVIVMTQLVDDLRNAQGAYLRDLAANIGTLQTNYQSQDLDIGLQRFDSSRCQ